MPRFRDIINSDLDAFLNQDEFAEVHKLGTQLIPMIVEEDAFNQITGGIKNKDFEYATQNLYESVTTIYLKASYYKKPAIGKRITLDDEKYYVVSSSISDGILKISLVANESYG